MVCGPYPTMPPELGADLLLWFEPERVAPDSWLDTNHPEWLLRVVDGEEDFTRWKLLNLGNPECRRWLTEHYCKLIREHGIRIYRQDFNFPPLRYWRENEAGRPPGDQRESARAGLFAVLG